MRLALSLSVVLCLAAPKVLAQEGGSPPGSSSESAVAASLDVQADAQPQEAMPWGDSAQTNTKPEGENRVQPGPNLQQNPPLPGQQPKRILGLMPNFRAVSAGATPPPATLRQNFIIATKNSFDYSSFAFVGITSFLAEADDVHPQLGGGFYGFTHYYWRGLVDKTDGNYWVIFVLPTLLHEDERYYALGQGGAWKRLTYAGTRIFITRNFHEHNTLNASEVIGRAIAQGISVTYYPSQTRTPGGLAQKYGYALGRDALTNIFREFWPDIAVHVLHRHP
ncbi:MAG TPA: hypothetical protein VFB23_10210 [Candidatus Acidoferrales bacterium]|nr:hypothetical protein [Candidatus Acidoferrales bacterium]